MKNKAHWGIVAAAAFITLKFVIQFFLLTEEWYSLSALGIAFLMELVVFLLYPFPFILYRYAIHKTYVENKIAARIVAYVYTIVLLVISMILHGDYISLKLVDIIWSEIAVLILRDGCDTKSGKEDTAYKRDVGKFAERLNRTEELQKEYSKISGMLENIEPDVMKELYESDQITFDEYYKYAVSYRFCVERMQKIREEIRKLNRLDDK